MKKLILLIFILFFSLKLTAQNDAQNDLHWRAVFQYKQIVSEAEKARRDSLIKAQPEMADLMKRMYKRYENRSFVMNFNKNESLFEEDSNPASISRISHSRGHRSYRDRALRNRKLYKNIPEKIYLDKRQVMDKDYLITDSLPKYDWKITNESKQIGNYMVIKATAKDPYDSKNTIEAWFTPELPISNGPKKYWGLPGFIMEVKDGQQVYLCKEIIINPKDKKKIERPSKGKVVDEKTYRKEVKKLNERMRKMYENRRGEGNRSGHIEIRVR